MSGHSKWHNIQQRKGKQDAAKSGLFTKFSKMIALAAQKSGDPETNFALRLAIDKAKQGGMPKDNIERAIKRGTGELSAGIRMEELLYEGFGPGGTVVLVKVVTDNKNRTGSEVKRIFLDHGGNMGSAGSVKWMFEQWGVIIISKEKIVNRDEFDLQMIEAGAEDIEQEDDQIEIKTKIENLQKVLQKLKEFHIEPSDSGMRWIAKEPVNVDGAGWQKLEALFGALEAQDDVEDYFTNAV